MKFFFVFFFLAFLLSSCIEFEDVEVLRFGKIQVQQIKGSTAKISVDLDLENPNFFSIKIKPSTLDLFVEDEYVGKAILLEKVKIIKKKTGTYITRVELIAEDGVLRKLLKYALKPELKIRVNGKVKGSVYGITKRIAIDETRTIDGRKFQLNLN
jgi:LEA14-like dessication related protein